MKIIRSHSYFTPPRRYEMASQRMHHLLVMLDVVGLHLYLLYLEVLKQTVNTI